MAEGPQLSVANGTSPIPARHLHKLHQLHPISVPAPDESSVVIDLREGATRRLLIEPAEDWARAVTDDLPERLRAEMGPSLERLSPEAIELLEVASFLNPSFSVGDAAEVLGAGAGALVMVLREVLDAGLLVPSGDALAFRDEALCAAIYGRIVKPVRLAIHRQIGAALLARGRLASRAAAHLIVGAEPGDGWAAEGLERAAQELLRSSPHAAAAMALRALELTDELDEQRLSYTATAVEATLAARRVAEATELAVEALAARVSAPVPAARLRLTLALVSFMRGRTDDAVSEADRILTEPGLPQRCYTAAEVFRLYALVVQREFARARQAAEDILSGRGHPGGDSALAGALAALSFVDWEEGFVAEALSLMRAAVGRGDRGPLEARSMHPRLGLALMLTALGDFTGAEAAIVASRHDIEASADTLWVAAPSAFLSRLHLAAGRLDEAVSEAEASMVLADDLGTRLFAPMALDVLACAGIHRGDLASATRYLERSRREPPSVLRLANGCATVWTGARLADAQGDRPRAAALLEDLYEDPVSRKRLFLEKPASAAWLVRFALAEGRRPQAEAVVVGVEQVAADNARFPAISAVSAHARGLLDGSVDLLELAAATHGHPWAAASASEDVGVVAAAAGDRAGAGARLERALAGYERAGAQRDATRVRARLREVGIRRRHWKRAERSAWGWDSLTETEQRVTALVAQGLTNLRVSERMFLSRHTIDFHLRQIFRKLGITSRVELTRLAIEHDGAGETSA